MNKDLPDEVYGFIGQVFLLSLIPQETTSCIDNADTYGCE